MGKLRVIPPPLLKGFSADDRAAIRRAFAEGQRRYGTRFNSTLRQDPEWDTAALKAWRSCETEHRRLLVDQLERRIRALEIMLHALEGPRAQLDRCGHPPKRLYAWRAADGAQCVACCECGSVLGGGVS